MEGPAGASREGQGTPASDANPPGDADANSGVAPWDRQANAPPAAPAKTAPGDAVVPSSSGDEEADGACGEVLEEESVGLVRVDPAARPLLRSEAGCHADAKRPPDEREPGDEVRTPKECPPDERQPGDDRSTPENRHSGDGRATAQSRPPDERQPDGGGRGGPSEKLGERAERIAFKLYGPGFYDDAEFAEWRACILKVNGWIGRGLVSLDRVLAAATDANNGWLADKVNHRGAYFWKLVSRLVSGESGELSGIARMLAADR